MGCCSNSSNSSRVSSVKGKARNFPDSDDFDGPVRERSCTDVIFLALLAIYLIFLLAAITVACVRGDPRRLVYGVDDSGNICGLKNEQIEGASMSGMDYKEMKYLEVTPDCTSDQLTTICTTTKKCVKNCTNGYKKTTLRRCMRKEVIHAGQNVLQSTLPYLEEVGSDISLCWKEILLLCLISIGLSVALLIVFRFCAAIIIWAVLIIVSVAAIGGTIYVWIMWKQRKTDLESYTGPNLELKEKQVRNWFIAAIVLTIFTVVYLLIVFFLRKRIKLAAALFQEAGKSIGAMPLILLQPVVTFISIAFVVVFLLVGFICLQTSGKALVDAQGKVTFPIDTFFQVMRWLSLFGFLWLTQFVFACQNMVVAGSISTWYFTRKKDNVNSPICKSFKMLVGYHLGSTAFGSLVIAIMKLIRMLFRLLEKYLNSQNQRCDVFWKIFQCCLGCFESYLKFLSKNAYIMIAIYGDSFCSSARRAFSTIASNALRVAAVDGIGSFILFIGKIGVTVSVGFIALEIFKQVEGLHYIWVLVGLVCIFAFLCSHCFLSIYEMTIETLLLCFCEDCQMNDGVNRPYFMSKSLMMFVENSRRSARIKSVPRNKMMD